MKQRVLVMNGQRILQTEQAGTWTNQRVDKAGSLKPGIYNLYTAQPADKARRHEGVIVHLDASTVYQRCGTQFVMHERSDFDQVPVLGSTQRVTYDKAGKARLAEAMSATRSRSRSL